MSKQKICYECYTKFYCFGVSLAVIGLRCFITDVWLCECWIGLLGILWIWIMKIDIFLLTLGFEKFDAIKASVTFY